MSDRIATFEVPIWSLDTLIKRSGHGRIRLLKIDVEGYELPVLKGAIGSLTKIDHIVFEALPNLEPDAAREIRNLLTTNGFSLRSVEGAPLRYNTPIPENNIWARSK